MPARGVRRAFLPALLAAGLAARAAFAGTAASATASLLVGESRISVEPQGAAPDLGVAGLRDWVRRSATIVAGYYGEFPVRAVSVTIRTSGDGAGVEGGRTVGFPGAHISVEIGRHVTAQTLYDDWVLVHEMVHLALPEVDDNQNWLAEGLATYVEGVARVQAGNLSEAMLWQEYLSDMPKGLPRPGDRGLDHTHTWARTYWGGALFCLVADVRIREQTGGRRGLQDALRALQREGAGMREAWSIGHILATADKATGTTVLADLYREMADQPVGPDLGQLFADLGVVAKDSTVTFDDTARLAYVRRAITKAPTRPPAQPPRGPSAGRVTGA